MPTRRSLIRIVGFGVAGTALVLAVQLLLLSFQSSPVVGGVGTTRAVGWLTRPMTPGAAVLGGVALLGFALWLAVGWIRALGLDRRVIALDGTGGKTRIDRASLESAFTRALEQVDRRNDVTVSVTRRGKINAQVVTPDVTTAGPARELRDAIDALCQSKSLPCRSGRITLTTPRRATARRSVR